MRSISLLLLSLLLLLFSNISAQLPAERGTWDVHLPFHEIKSVAGAGNKIYGATDGAILIYDLDDGSVEKLTKVDGLSDVNISTIEYHPELEYLIIAYSNGNLDLYKNGEFININAIKISNIIGDKTINQISIYQNEAYLSCGFGIVVINLEKEEVKDTYILGTSGDQTNVNATTIWNDTIFAATISGLYKASIKETFLSNFNVWEHFAPSIVLEDSVFSDVVALENGIFTTFNSNNFSGDSLYYYDSKSWTNSGLADLNVNEMRVSMDKETFIMSSAFNILEFDREINSVRNIYQYDPGVSPRPLSAIKHPNGYLFVGDQRNGLVETLQINSTSYIKVSGPANVSVFDIDFHDGQLWTAPGGVIGTSWLNSFVPGSFSKRVDGQWTAYSSNSELSQVFNNTLFDVLSVEVNPTNPEQVFIGSYHEYGIIELINNEFSNQYTPLNSTIRGNGKDEIRLWISDMEIDEDGNLWAANSTVANNLIVRKADGTWNSFSIRGSGVSSTSKTGKLFLTSGGIKFISYPKVGIGVYDDQGTIDDKTDDQSIVLTGVQGRGNLPDETVNAFAEDKDGEVWIGTNKGVAVFFVPNSILNNGNVDAQQILIEQDGNFQILLETETILSIGVDAGNRKWIGTSESGIFVVSEDGQDQIVNFNTDNSPLYSNQINSIEFDEKTGEVWIGTPLGLMSYVSDATQPDINFSNVVVYPNPVTADYNGEIAIKGLAFNSDVKITDISGNIIFHTTAVGGQAFWNGNTLNGQRANTGVYLVFCTDEEGDNSQVAKILLTN